VSERACARVAAVAVAVAVAVTRIAQLARKSQVGPSTPPDELVAVIRRLWPDPPSAPGKIMLITRFGAGLVREKLPPLIAAIHAAGLGAPVLWTCDPMHGNTRVTSEGLKTRDFDDIVEELRCVSTLPPPARHAHPHLVAH